MTTLNVFRKNRSRVRSGQMFLVDYWLILAVAGLLIIGMLMVYSTTFDLGLQWHDKATYFFEKQLIALVIGIAGALILMRFDYHGLRRLSVPILLATLILLVVVLLFGDRILGARRGLYAGSIQPSEIAKIAVILYITHWLSTKGDRIKNLTYGLMPFSVITGVVCALIVLQPDIGTAALIAIIALTLFFIAGADLKQFAIAGTLGGGIFFFLITTIPHAAARIESWEQALKDPTQAGWQVQQAVVALGIGGWFGVGLGESTQKFGPLPAAHTDGVFAILGEELGFFGCILVILLMTLLAWRGIRTALGARDGYGFLLAVGITSWLLIQALINMAVITAVMPFTGMPLPFLSYGGSSLAISLIGIGILLSISRDAAMNVKVQHWKPIRESLRESLDLRRRNGRTHLSSSGRRR
ncbi:MAG TPA: putative lipid II flippase FtsW [Chloroflexi bacterium]|jgi:cell division protein FtsW|nr:putative lipid II flippase FtsW [Chloroflexota bacterium]